jgi:methylmalonyl-CoA mutase
MAIDNLLREFPSISTEAWEEAIRRDLKGADYQKRLIWQSDEGIAVKPYYRAEDLAGLEYLSAAPGDFPYVRGTQFAGGWRIREEIEATDPQEASQAAQSAIAAGAEEIAFKNVKVENAAALAILLANLSEVPVHFEDADEALVRLIVERLSGRSGSTPVSTGFDPLANLEFAAEVLSSAPRTLQPFTVHAEEFEESGATAVEEAAFALAAGIDFLSEMQARNLGVDRAAASAAFSFAIGSNYFFQIAKLRAFRMLWARAVESFGGNRENAKARIHASTSRWNKTLYDPHANILRGTTEAMSAILGGADSVSVAPFDDCYKAPDPASRRLARNTQILLKHEALLARVADPAAGSYCIEALTDSIAREAWKRMQQIEAAGGFRKAQAEGRIREALEKSLNARAKAIISRRRVFTGTNQYANAAEKALNRINEPRLTSRQRGTQGFEQLRLRTERHAAKRGSAPLVLLAEFGDPQMRTARSGFASSLLACAGFDLITRAFTSAGEIAAGDCALIVLCSSDPEYLPMATSLMGIFKETGRTTPVLIAGNPETAQQLLAAGVADFVHIRSNPIELLAAWQQRLGITD